MPADYVAKASRQRGYMDCWESRAIRFAGNPPGPGYDRLAAASMNRQGNQGKRGEHVTAQGGCETEFFARADAFH
jgi:hypothetical protein